MSDIHSVDADALRLRFADLLLDLGWSGSVTRLVILDAPLGRLRVSRV